MSDAVALVLRSYEAEAEGASLLDDVYQFLDRFVSYPSEHARVAHSLWIMHTHLMEAWESTPRIAFLSPEPGSGKTRALEVTATMVPRPVESVNVSAAYLFRRITSVQGLPTILFDEMDTVFGSKAQDHEDLRAILNAGHRRGAKAGRCVVRGNAVLTQEFDAYSALALAGLGNLPATILSRSIVVPMRRRAPTERIEPFRQRIHEPQGNAIRDKLARWAKSLLTAWRAEDGFEWPDMPRGVQDRAADIWESLIAVADAAGGSWPQRARDAAVAFVAASAENTPSLGVRLLADLRLIFDQDAHRAKPELPTAVILDCLLRIEEAPWADVRGKPIDDRRLAGLLRQFGVRSAVLAGGHKRGYRRQDLLDPWARYLKPTPQGA